MNKINKKQRIFEVKSTRNMERKYLSEQHRQASLARIKAVKEMQKTPMSREAMKAQCDRIKKESKGI